MSWLTNYDYRKSITIHHTVDGAQTNYQMPVKVYRSTGTDGTEAMGAFTAGKVYVSTKCKTDYSDIRFTKSDGTTLLDYWIETSDSSSAVIWVEFDSIPASGDASFYLYYGYASATAVSNGDNTFLFFDDFPGTSLDTNKWQGGGGGSQDGTGKCSVSGGILSMVGGGDGGEYGIWAKYGSGAATSAMRLKAQVISSDGSGYRLVEIGLAWSSAGGARSSMYMDNVGNVLIANPGHNNSSNMSYNAYKTWDFIIVASTGTYVYENGAACSNSPNTTGAPNQTAIGCYMTSYDSISAAVRGQYDWVLQHNYTVNAPAWGDWGTEETPAAPPASAFVGSIIPAIMQLI